MIEMELSGIGFDPRNMSPIVLLKDTEERNFLPIWIGMFEAAAITMKLQSFDPPRPLTHDIIIDIMDNLKAKAEKVIISDIKEDTFYAVLEIRDKDDKLVKLDIRPSDAIAVAVRTDIPIYVAENVMIEAKMVNSEKDAEETKKFKDFIENVNPEDFQKYIDKR